MSVLQDDDLRQHEESQDGYTPGAPLSPAETAELDQIEAGLQAGEAVPDPYQQSLPEFDPNKRIARANDEGAAGAEKRGDGAATETNTEGEAAASAEGGFNYSQGATALKSALQGAGVVGGGALLAKAAFSALKNNKGKAAAGGGIAGLIIMTGFFASSLALVSLKNNAEKKLGGITNTIFDEQFANSTFTERSAIKRLFKSLRVEQNIAKLDESLGKAGYKVTAGGLEVPPAGGGAGPPHLLTDSDEILSELKSEAKKALPTHNLRGLRMRNKATKELAKRIGIAQTAAAASALKADEDAKAKAKEEARKGAIEGEEPTSEQFKTAQAEGADTDSAKASKEAGEELIEDGGKDIAEDSEAALARSVAREGGEEVVEKVAKGVGESIAGRIGNTFKGNFVDIMQVTCRIGGAARAAYVGGLIAKKVNLMKVFGVFVNNADAIVTGNVNAAVLKGFMDATWTNQSSGKSIDDSGGLSSILGKDNGDPSEASFSFFRTDRQDIGGFMGVVIALTGNSLYNTFCDGVDTLLCTIVCSAAEWAIPVIAGVVTAPAGGSGGAAVVAGEQAAAAAVKTSISKVVGKALIKAIGQAVAIEITTQLGEAWMKSYVGSLFSSTMVTFSSGEAGPFMGDAFSAGAGAYFEMNGRDVGMRPLNQIAYNDAMKRVREAQRTELAQKSLFERFAQLDYSNTDSLTAHLLVGSPIAATNPGTIIKNLAQSFINTSPLAQAQQFASTAVSGSAFAQSQAEEVKIDSNGYVTDAWGNFIVGNNFDGIDMVANYDSLVASGDVNENGEPIDGKPLAEYLKNCTDIDIRKMETTNEVNPSCVSAEAKKYQAYLVFRSTFDTLDVAYHPIESTGGSGGGTGGSVNPTEDTSGIPCPAGTEDGGVHQDYGPGRTPGVRIRICGIPGAIPAAAGVNSSAAANALALIEAAKADGYSFAGSAFRSYDRQKELRVEHGCADDSLPSRACSPPTARPGNSMHELGLAIDFSSYNFTWLSQNAGRFGFKNLPSEAWHWSVNGH